MAESASSKQKRSTPEAALQRELDAFTQALAAAVSSGGGVPELARVASRALTASVAVFDSGGNALAIAGATKADERQLATGKSISVVELVVAGRALGELRFRSRAVEPANYMVQILSSAIALEMDRQQGVLQDRLKATQQLVDQLAEGASSDQLDSSARAAGFDLGSGATVVAFRVEPKAPQHRDWRLAVASSLRQVASFTSGALTASFGSSFVVLVPSLDDSIQERLITSALAQLNSSAKGSLTVSAGSSLAATNPSELREALFQALMSANTAYSNRQPQARYEDSGAHRLLLALLIDNQDKLEQFVEDTVGPILSYEEQYQTGLILTVKTYLGLDGKIEATAKQLFTHRHTVRYRLERVRELTGLDITTSEGREQLGLGLKAMQVLGIKLPLNSAEGTEEAEVGK